MLNDDDKVTLAHLPAQLTRKPSKARTVTPPHVESAQVANVNPVSTATPMQAQPLESAPVETSAQPEFSSTMVANEAPPASPAAQVSSPYFNSDGTIRPMWKVEREAIQNAIAYCDGNVLNAAVMLELSPSTVYRKKQAWEADEANLEQS